MRLSKTLYYLKRALKTANLQRSQSVVGGQALTQFNDLNSIRNFVTNIEKTELFKTETTFLKSTQFFSVYDSAFAINPTDANRIIGTFDNLKFLVSMLVTNLESLVGEENENEIFIKIPEITDFEQLSEIAIEIQKVLSQIIYNKTINGKIKIEGVDSGSIWFKVLVGSTLAVQLIGAVAWSSAVIYKKIQEGKILTEQATMQNYKAEEIKALAEANKIQINMLLNMEARHIYNQHLSAEDADQIERIKHSINLFVNLIDKGTEIQASLEAPENVSNLFPDMKNLPTISSKIQQLENK